MTLANAEKLIATWEVARTNAGATGQISKENMDMVAVVESETTDQYGTAMGRMNKVYELVKKYRQPQINHGATTSRGPVKSRLGFKPMARIQQVNREGRINYGTGFRNLGHDGRFDGQRHGQRSDYSQMICNFCGIKGHIKKRCFKLKNLHHDAVNLVDSSESGPATDRQISEMLERMRTQDSEDEKVIQVICIV